MASDENNEPWCHLVHEAPCVCAGNSKQQTASLASSQVPAQLVPQQHPPTALCLGEPHPPATFRHCQRLTAASRSSPRQPTAGPLSTVTGQCPLRTHPAASRPRLKDPSYDPRCIWGTGQPRAGTSPPWGNGPSSHLCTVSMMGKNFQWKKSHWKSGGRLPSSEVTKYSWV